MKRNINTVLFALLLLLAMPAKISAQEENIVDSLQVSLLTCGPGEDVYELYGHTALRVKDVKNGEDLVFNYGIFDFDTPHFAWRFMLGQTDYKLGVLDYDRFIFSYARHGRYVDEQVLNLLPEEKASLWNSLKENWSDRYWTYRYNFLYDNCTTRAVAQVTSCVKGRIVWPVTDDGKRTFRTMLHEFTAAASPWNCFGQDLILGEEVDRSIYVEQQMFSPLYAEHFFDVASVKNADGSSRLLVTKKQRVVDVAERPVETFPVSPMMAAILLLVLVGIVTAIEFVRKRLFFPLDYLLMLLQGVAGCIVGLLFFFSEHPAVGSNWLIVLLNPVPLAYLPFKIWRDHKYKKDFYYPLVAVGLAVFFVSILFGVQNYPMPFYILALILLLRTVVSLTVYPTMRSKHKHHHHHHHH